MRIKLITLGCSKNRVDSEHLSAQLESNHIEVIQDEDNQIKYFDAIILNTCGFIKDAKEESIEAVFSAVSEKRSGRAGKVLVFGCLSKRYHKELESLIPEVDAFFDTEEFEKILDYLGGRWYDNLKTQRVLSTPSHYAYLKISEGCDRNCAFCAIPSIRGNHRSVPMELLLEEAQILASRGVKELILVAQDTTYYGIDLYGKRELPNLVSRLAKIEKIEWIRIHYSYPASFPEDLLEVMKSEQKVCKYLDIPFQHISTEVLTKMRRSIDSIQTIELISKLRQIVPDIVLRTTLIVGHPGEKEEDFKELLEFVKLSKFERLGAFTYSREEGTYGAGRYRDTIKQEIKDERYSKLMELQSSISNDFNILRVGKEERVIIDRQEGDYYIARSYAESPEVDPEILVRIDSIPQNLKSKNIIGTFASVIIEDANEYDLFAKFV